MPITDMDAIVPLFDAVSVHRNNYNSGDTDYSVTTLLNPPRIVHLEKRHAHKVDRYVHEQLGSFIGTALHEYMERCLLKHNEVNATEYHYECEERLDINIRGRKVSGAYDFVKLLPLQQDMYDLKTTSVWKAMFGDKNDWARQQNMYRFLYHHHKKKTLASIRIMGMYLDWSLREKMQYGRKYPTFKVMEYSLPRWDMQKTYDYMDDRVQVMIDHEDTDDDDLPPCTYEDMWSKPDKFAVKANNRKNALRVCDSEADAAKWTSEYLKKDSCKHKFADLELECRPSVRTRCEHWCPVNTYCNQFNDYLTAMALHNKKGV